MISKFKRIKFACYTVNISMAIVVNLPPILFLTFRNLYSLSYSQLGMLVLINYLTQLSVDLVFSFFSHKFNIPKTVKITPVLTFVGLVVYALWPFFFGSNVLAGLIIGTVIFSSSGGLVEVLISPVIAAIPSDDPDREMSKLHSVYAWGVVGIVLISTAFIAVFGAENWQYLMLILTILPLVSAFLFFGSELPEMETPEKASGALELLKNKGVWLCVGAIFLGGATECTMAQWVSGYTEQALGINKTVGDIFGTALFALMLGTGRTLYSKKGKNIRLVLFTGALTASVCYFLCAVTTNPFVGLTACAVTGLCVSMLWPGSLIVASDKFPKGGVFIFAMMASGGDLGASVGPQIVGVVTDTALKIPYLASMAEGYGLSPEQFGMKLGMLIGMLFPIMAAAVYFYILKQRKHA